MSKRNRATLARITTQSSNRLARRRLASSHTETSSLSRRAFPFRGSFVRRTQLPIYESFTLHHAMLCLAGRDLTEYLTKNLSERGFSFSATAEKETVRVVIETFCYMRFDHGTELESTADIDKNQTHVLSDGNIRNIVSTALKSCSSQVSLAKKPAVSPTFLIVVRWCRSSVLWCVVLLRWLCGHQSGIVQRGKPAALQRAWLPPRLSRGTDDTRTLR